MRYKVSPKEVFSLWARQEQDHAEAQGRGNVYFSTKTCYSYGSHFPIATHIGNNNVLFTLQTYSNSTAKHCHYALRACHNAGLNIIYCYSVDSERDSIRYWENQIEDLFAQIANPNNRKFDNRVAKLETIYHQVAEYLTVRPVELSFKTAAALAFINAGDIVNKLRK